MEYRRASKKQLEYIAILCERLDVTNESLYTKFTVDRARKYIDKLKRKIEQKENQDRQQTLL